MTDLPTPFDLTSHDLPADKQQALLALFPEIRTEGGRIDFDRLKLALGETVDTGRERYGLTWPGKADCFKTIQAPSTGTLRPCPEESVNFETTENLIIEGDNLEVLKLLQKAYLGKVKMIYIDPPYNTGNDFIYPDNYTESLQTYLEYTGQVDSAGRKFSTNSDTDGRFHSKWLNMMYPRLYLARNLLRDDGAIFISIDDGEVANIRNLGDEVFGEANFIINFVWEKRTTRENRRIFSVNHDYILCYAKHKDLFEKSRNMLPLTEDALSRYSNPDNDIRGDWQSVSLNAQAGHATPNQFYELVTPSGKRLNPPPGRCWVVTKDRLNELIADNRVWFGGDGNNVPRLKVFLAEAGQGLTPHTLWKADEVGTTDSAKKALNDIFGGDAIFDTPKPIGLLKRILQISSSEKDLVMDFFAGSGTVAHAVLDLNQQDGGNRKFILVQLPEPTENKDFPTIAEITKERVRRVIRKLNDVEAGQLPLHGPQDRGFRVFKLAKSNFNAWNAQIPHDTGTLERQLELHIEHIRPGRTSADILYELLLKSGFPLTTPVETLKVSSLKRDPDLPGKPLGSEFTIHRVAGGLMLVCLEKNLTLEVLRAMADLQPERVVCLDAGFADDALKTNAVQIFKTKGIVFRTV